MKTILLTAFFVGSLLISNAQNTKKQHGKQRN